MVIVGFVLGTWVTTVAAATPPANASRPAAPLSGDAGALRAFLSGRKGLTADDVARRAAASSRDAEAKHAEAAAASAKEDQALATLWPRLGLQARYTRTSPFSIPFGPMTFVLPVNNTITQASLTVPVSDYVLRASTAIATASHSAKAAAIDEQASRLKSAADARLAFYDWIRARGQALIADQALAQARGHASDAQKLAAAGLLSRADLLRAEAAAKAAELFVTRATNLVGITADRLRVVMHDDGSTPLELGEDLLADLPPYPLPADEAALYTEALEHRLEVRALDETDASLAGVVKLAKTQGYPRLDLAGNVVYGSPNPRIFPPQNRWDMTWDASVILSWTPTDIPSAAATEREQAARRRELQANRARLLDGLRLEVGEARGTLREAEAALASTTQAVAAAEESHRARTDLFKNGKATVVELTDAETELTRARLELVNAHIDARTSRVRLDHALGRDAR
jgi:outer membrane protein